MNRSVSEALYRISLEQPSTWWFFIGPGLEERPPYLNIGLLDSFVSGYSWATEERDSFFSWLRDEANAFPGDGWPKHLLKRAEGDHLAAISSLFSLLHRFLLETRPAWFVAFNQHPQPSMLVDGLGASLTLDVRLESHVMAVTGAPPVVGPELRISAFDFKDGFVMTPGLPDDVSSWWNGSGRRIACMGSKERLAAVRGGRTPLEVTLDAQENAPACVMDASTQSVSVVCSGQAGAVHVRERSLIALTQSRAVTQWAVRPGDRLLMLSPALYAVAVAAGVGQLSSQLATGEPVAWAQAVETPERRLAVAVVY